MLVVGEKSLEVVEPSNLVDEVEDAVVGVAAQEEVARASTVEQEAWKHDEKNKKQNKRQKRKEKLGVYEKG